MKKVITDWYVKPTSTRQYLRFFIILLILLQKSVPYAPVMSRNRICCNVVLMPSLISDVMNDSISYRNGDIGKELLGKKHTKNIQDKYKKTFKYTRKKQKMRRDKLSEKESYLYKENKLTSIKTY